ncbi:MAG: hypothetical protein OHK0015_07220 [Chloroflexi bacterium OHK40]
MAAPIVELSIPAGFLSAAAAPAAAGTATASALARKNDRRLMLARSSAMACLLAVQFPGWG